MPSCVTCMMLKYSRNGVTVYSVCIVCSGRNELQLRDYIYLAGHQMYVIVCGCHGMH